MKFAEAIPALRGEGAWAVGFHFRLHGDELQAYVDDTWKPSAQTISWAFRQEWTLVEAPSTDYEDCRKCVEVRARADKAERELAEARSILQQTVREGALKCEVP